ncbi:MAG: hypothetical protein BSOLF_1497 [Candidatus Carbobacillus altaicus]|uniref:Uncharacterized protein n=1 Tax=Candidatus Carbonibacillus altaicus TaxID=2163959 RepID=A0A2R6XZB8_9BACL|nr:MAG: hypothetical protein BSOLF_1497 [Candidatus Carbobacillus altaicus]
MLSRQEKWHIIRRFAATGIQDPGRIAVLAFLAGRLERVRFMRSLDFSETGALLSTRSLTLWPRPAFMGMVRGVSFPDPFLWMAALVDDDGYIDVKLDFDGSEEAEWFVPHLYEDARDPMLRPEVAEAEIKASIDRALDVYQAAKARFEEALHEASPDLEEAYTFFLTMAKRDIERLSHALSQLKARNAAPSAYPPEKGD